MLLVRVGRELHNTYVQTPRADSLSWVDAGAV